MVDWLAGKRVRGTSSERSGFGTSLGGTGVGGWVELGRTTLGSSSANIDVTGLADKRYLMVLSNFNSSTTSGNPYIRINGDTGSNYSMRYSRNGGADSTITSASAGIFIGNLGSTDLPYFMVDYIANYSSKEKLILHHMVNQNTAGAGTAPNRSEVAGKWANTSSAVSQVNINGNGVNIDSGGECVVLGYDPADTHTNNFWEELLSETVVSNTDSHTFSSFSAKKYLWIQLYYKYGSGTPRPIFQFNGDTGTNYAERRSDNGGADNLATSAIQIIAGNWDTTNTFSNFFIINNASNEKLGIQHWVNEESAGAGTAPHRRENVFKWANTSNQITSITIKDAAASPPSSIGAGTTIKVWGAD